TGFQKAPAPTSPIPPATGYALPRCYAAPLADCSSKLTREHYVSKSLLEELNRLGGLHVGGLRREPEGQQKVLPPNAVACKMLCDRHNPALSPLDAIALRLFHAFNEDAAPGSGRRLVYLFSGHDVERWLLKLLCGLACSGNLLSGSGIDVSIPRQWLEILFGYTSFPDGQGLYVCKDPGHRFEGPQGLQVRAITVQGRLSGLG